MTTTNDTDGRNGDSTPVEGVPISTSGLDPDTGKISTRLHAQIASTADRAAVVTSPGGIMTPEAFLDALAAKVATKVNGSRSGGSSGSQGGSRRFLGLALGSWTKMVLAWLMAALVALAAWHFAVRDELRQRPTTPQIEESVRETFEYHNYSSQAHPPIQRRLDTLGNEQKKIRESQVRQETTGKSQTKILDEIRGDVKQLRRRRPR